MFVDGGGSDTNKEELLSEPRMGEDLSRYDPETKVEKEQREKARQATNEETRKISGRNKSNPAWMSQYEL